MEKALAIQKEVQKILFAIIVTWKQKYVRTVTSLRTPLNFIRLIMARATNHYARSVVVPKRMLLSSGERQKTQPRIKSIIIKLISAFIASPASVGAKIYTICIGLGKTGMTANYLSRVAFVQSAVEARKRTGICILTTITHTMMIGAGDVRTVLGGYCAKNATAASGRSMTIQGDY